jgi:RHS repeat-associated protein
VNDKKLDMVYDYQGRRVQKITSNWNGSAWVVETTKRFVYDGWNVLEEQTVSQPSKYYVWGLDLSQSLQGAGGIGGLLARVESSTTHNFLHDGNGNVGQLINAATGTTDAQYEYDPYGNSIVATGVFAATNPYRFSTKYLDGETGLYYYGQRYYDPQTGRWLSRDPLEELGHEIVKGLPLFNSSIHPINQNLHNPYWFVFNNTINLFDLFGEAGFSSSIASNAICVGACWLGFKNSDGLRHFWQAWKDPSKLPRSVRRRFELEARKQLTGSRAKPTRELMQKAVRELGEKKLKSIFTKRLGKKVAEKIAPNLIPGIGQAISVALTAIDIGQLCYCEYLCVLGRFR